MRRILRITILHVLGVLMCLATHQAQAQTVTVKAGLDSAYILMGRVTALKLTVDQPKNVKGVFPLLKNPNQDGLILVCNDSVELRTPTKIDTVTRGNELRITLSVPLQAFDSGYYKLPAFEFVAGQDTVRSNRIGFKVIPVVPAEADMPIADFAGVSKPADSKFTDMIPDVIWNWWWLILIVLAAIGVFIWAMRRYKKEGTILKPKPAPAPYDVAVASLRELKGKKLWEQGMEKEYFTDLTEILRVYLAKRFGINAMEMTSRQIIAALNRNPETKDKKSYVRQILDMADFVKFAKVRPLPDDNELAFDNALKFVHETKPVPVEEKAKGGEI